MKNMNIIIILYVLIKLLIKIDFFGQIVLNYNTT